MLVVYRHGRSHHPNRRREPADTFFSTATSVRPGQNPLSFRARSVPRVEPVLLAAHAHTGAPATRCNRPHPPRMSDPTSPSSLPPPNILGLRQRLLLVGAAGKKATSAWRGLWRSTRTFGRPIAQEESGLTSKKDRTDRAGRSAPTS